MMYSIDGKYFSGESKMDLDVKLNQLNLAILEIISCLTGKRYEGLI